MAKQMKSEVQAEQPEVQGEVTPVKEKPTKTSPFTLYEVWRMEWEGIGNDRKLIKSKKKKVVGLLPEQADELNTQTHNTLLLYEKKGR